MVGDIGVRELLVELVLGIIRGCLSLFLIWIGFWFCCMSRIIGDNRFKFESAI